MKLPPKPGRLLALPALVAAVLTGLGAAAVVATAQILASARAEQKATAVEREAAQNKLARATDEEREIREKLVDYRRLRERGLIGDEQRLEWVDRIAQIKAARKLFDVKYSIEPQRPADYPGVAGSGEVEFLVSPMTLEMTLLHEEDLLRFVNDLRGALSSHVVVRSCSVERAEQPAQQGRALGPRLKANCTIDLVTIRDRQSKPG